MFGYVIRLKLRVSRAPSAGWPDGTIPVSFGIIPLNFGPNPDFLTIVQPTQPLRRIMPRHNPRGTEIVLKGDAFDIYKSLRTARVDA